MITSTRAADGRVAVIRLDRPPVNALDAHAYRAMAEALRETERDDRICAVVIVGAGAGAFCAGTDIRELECASGFARVSAAALELFETLSTFPKPLIGALNGPAVGGGAMIAAECDVLLAVAEGSLSIPELTAGFIGAASHVKRLVPFPKAQRMMLLGEPLEAEEALALGVLAAICEDRPRLLESAITFGTRIAGLDAAVVQAARRILRTPESRAALSGYRQEVAVLSGMASAQRSGASDLGAGRAGRRTRE